MTVGVTIKAIGPTPAVIRADRDSVYWDLVYDGASMITLTSANIETYGAPVGITSGTPVVTTLNSTTRRVTISNVVGAGALRFRVAANTASSISGNHAYYVILPRLDFNNCS